MTKSRFPFLTTLLCALAAGLALLPMPVQEALYLDYHRVTNGDWIGLLSGHWLHVGGNHLAWNVGALAILAGLIETRSRQLLLWCILTGTVGVNLLLLSPLAGVDRYCGLSGLLNTLLGAVLFLLWQRTHSRLVLLVGGLCLGKIALEILLGDSLFTNTLWPPYPPAHLAGIVATPIALLLGYRDTSTRAATRLRDATGALHP